MAVPPRNLWIKEKTKPTLRKGYLEEDDGYGTPIQSSRKRTAVSLPIGISERRKKKKFEDS
jgi:hypothetical protein